MAATLAISSKTGQHSSGYTQQVTKSRAADRQEAASGVRFIDDEKVIRFSLRPCRSGPP